MRRRRRGLSLLETMIASILITAMIISLMGTWPAYHQLLEKKKRRATAVFLVARQIELALDLGFDGVGAVGGAPLNETVTVESIISNVPQVVDYQVTRTVEPDPDDPGNPLLKRVKVKVEYDEKGGHRVLELGATLGG